MVNETLGWHDQRAEEPMMSLTRTAAEHFAAQVLAWIAEDYDRLGSFLGWSGLSPADLRGRVNEPELLLAVIEFLLLDDAQLIEACRALDYPPTTPLFARAALPGGDDPHWT